MDKETLSNYGWIVICVLVLAVMIALATPFGSFVADAVKSTTQGLFDVNQNALNSTGLINIDGQTFGEGGNGGAVNGGSGDQGGSALPAIGTSAEDCTWDEIKAISEAGKGDEYFNLGDTKTFTTTDGNTIVMEIVAFNADTKADEAGTAGITWLSKKIVTRHQMNSTETNKNGWVASELRTWLQGEFYNTLPVEIRNSVVSVNKSYYDKTSNSTLTCVDNVWIPSSYEIYGTTSSYGKESDGVYYDHLSTMTSRIRYDSEGNVANWFLRTASEYGQHFRGVNQDGTSYPTAQYMAWGNQGVVLGFCT